MTQYIFEKIIFKKIELNTNDHTYFVFDKKNNIVKVEADNVHEAILKSKIHDPIMVKNILSIANSSGVLGDQVF